MVNGSACYVEKQFSDVDATLIVTLSRAKSRYC